MYPYRGCNIDFQTIRQPVRGEDRVFPHLHVELADTSFRGFGGHLLSAVVSGTCEVVVNVLEGYLRRELKLPAHRRGFPARKEPNMIADQRLEE
jgi:hypothetical protein